MPIIPFRCKLFVLSLFFVFSSFITSLAQHSVARKWNEIVLEAIRNDYARPTVHARNLFHTSIAMYDMWAVYEDQAETFLIGRETDGFRCEFNGIVPPPDKRFAQEEAMSFAVYRLLKHRFTQSPNGPRTIFLLDSLMTVLRYNPEYVSQEYSNNVPAALGNYMAQCLINFGLQDGSNEQNDYTNLFYQPVNPPLLPKNPGNPDIIEPNRWQPLSLDVFIDQSGNETPFNTPEFLGSEWGKVTSFALKKSDLTIHNRDGNEYWAYFDPGPPPYLKTDGTGLSAEYIWGFALVSIWSSHLDTNDQVIWDISPNSVGNISNYPETIEGLREFYDQIDGGDPGQGYDLNPATGEPYQQQMVLRGDYVRVLAEFWADGPDSETPPGHWFSIMNYVNDHPEVEKRFKGAGPLIDDLEWDVKAYLILGGAMHDAAIASWGIKGWYDYIRPVSAIRYMADMGQSTNPDLPRYSPEGLPLINGFIELVQEGDSLSGTENEHVDKIKLYAWRGPDYIINPENDHAGVGWILAENWWPYQRPSFVTPPFAGYISGHSTFSRAAAEVLTLLTGTPFFPGGMGEFQVKKNEFLVFEDGPSEDLTLQWATYRDASDQTSLSRIWGGIHPPVDDIPGRMIGERVGIQAFEFAENLFKPKVTGIWNPEKVHDPQQIKIYPNPVQKNNLLTIQSGSDPIVKIKFYNLQGIAVRDLSMVKSGKKIEIDTDGIPDGFYFISIQTGIQTVTQKLWIR